MGANLVEMYKINFCPDIKPEQWNVGTMGCWVITSGAIALIAHFLYKN
jgi:hypothetical protein